VYHRGKKDHEKKIKKKRALLQKISFSAEGRKSVEKKDLLSKYTRE